MAVGTTLKSLAAPTLAATAALMIASTPASAQSTDKFKASMQSELGKSGAGMAAVKARTGENRVLSDFYGDQQFRAIWFSDAGPTQKAKIFLDRLSKADTHGLDPEDYLYKSLAKGVENYDPSKRAALEIMMSRAFARYATDINAGRLHPMRLVPSLYIRPVRPDPERLLIAAAKESDFSRYVDSLPPRTPQYKRLVGALAAYRAIAKQGGWKPVPAGETLKPGMTDPRVAKIKARLVASGDLKEIGPNPTLYDETLVKAVKRFQFRHGLNRDGNVGKGTTKAMNVPISVKLKQIVLNLERRRWMPDDLGDRYVFVNIADQRLKVVVNAHSKRSKTIHTTRTVVGRSYHRTPVFSGMMSYVRINPHWNVPQSIARKEMLPKLKRDPSYLSRGHYLLLTRPIDNESAISPSSVDWASLSRSNFPYWIRQKPGPWNALGTIIFMFPNPHNIFIHDTAARSLFVRENRFFSHGCIRVQNPHAFARVVFNKLKAHDAWTPKKIQDTIKTRKEIQVNLKVKLPVHITYLTAWSNRDGTHHFRADVYKRDNALEKVLKREIAAGRRGIAKSAGPGKSG